MRRCFFVFDYDNDLWRANQITDLGIVHAAQITDVGIVDGAAAAGFGDLLRWEEAKKKGSEEVRRLIEEALSGTSVTVVLIGEATAGLDYVNDAIEMSIRRNNGLLGIFVHELKDHEGGTSSRGKVPFEHEVAEKLDAGGYDTHDWDQEKFEEWVNLAATEWRNFARKMPVG